MQSNPFFNKLHIKTLGEKVILLEKKVKRLDLRLATICKTLKSHGMDINKADMDLDKL